MDNKLAELESKLKVIPKDKEKVVMAFSFIGAIGRKDNLLDDIFQYAHVRNGAAEAGLDQGSSALSKERIIAIDPDVFFCFQLGILILIMMCKNMHSRWLLILPLRISKR